jgi:hypothetical protein
VGVARIAQPRGITDIKLPMLIAVMMLMMQIAAKCRQQLRCAQREGLWGWACRGLPVVGGWGMGPMTWTGKEDWEKSRTGCRSCGRRSLPPPRV